MTLDLDGKDMDFGATLPLLWQSEYDGHVAGVFVPHGWPQRIVIATAIMETSTLFHRVEDRPLYWEITALNGKALYYEQEVNEQYTRLQLARCEWSWETPE